MNRDAFQAFEDAQHEALRVAHDAIAQAAFEAKQSVDKVTHDALLVAYGQIAAASAKLREALREDSDAA